MHILLTDRLACPRCGPAFGLILLADRIDDRRVLDGRLGCANCREQYPVAGGSADLRTGPSAAEPDGPADGGQEAAVRIAALVGLADNPGPVLIAGPGAELAPAVAALVAGPEIVALTARPSVGVETPGVSRLAAGPAIPFQDRTLRGVALTGGADRALLAEAVRVLVPGSRLVVDPASPSTADEVRALGAEVLLDQAGAVVAAVR
ncbi:MAG: hypothetical protein JWM27_555 [Gemmatimonadetes bacterium]|nr:hypothetical protein [Gemmatimonadota bacterium]